VNHVDELLATRAADPAGFARAYLDYVADLVRHIDAGAIAAFIALLLGARARGATVFFIGNGGSAATASHFANDLAIGTRTGEGKPFRAMSLTDNVAVLTALANDEGYDRIFVDQLKVHMREGDALVAISASGNSPNVCAAAAYCRERGAKVVALTGFDGGCLNRLADVSIHISTAKGEYGPVEDLHMVVDHLIGAYLAHRVRGERSGPGQ
jgi:D-sedoheptulose 7-phosphate isomerase